MLNEEIHGKYHPVDDIDAVTNSHADSSGAEENEEEYGEEE